MGDLLIRNIDPATKRALSMRAAKHGRSQQAEARAILEKAVSAGERSWASRLYEAGQRIGGVDLEAPKRHQPRMIDEAAWL